jgi:hypothetical protein
MLRSSVSLKKSVDFFLLLDVRPTHHDDAFCAAQLLGEHVNMPSAVIGA